MLRMTQKDILQWVSQLSVQEQVQVAEKILANVSKGLSARITTSTRPKKKIARKRPSPYGMWKDSGFTITDEDIAEARKEMWGNFGERGF
ncbi:MAG: hypothetical protein HY740_06310 [Chloroflexi bacterium]|nr:hypothetical protein [Chloroflexota bacterium]